MFNNSHTTTESSFLTIGDSANYSSSFRLEGYLWKLGAVRRSWKRRWFTVSLLDPRMFYYRYPTDAVPLGHINLEDVSLIIQCETPTSEVCFLFPTVRADKGEFGIAIHTPNRIYYLTTDSELTQRYWVQGLQNFKRHINDSLQEVNRRMYARDTTFLPEPSVAAIDIIHNIEMLGNRIEECMRMISNRLSVFNPEFEHFLKVRLQLQSNVELFRDKTLAEQISQIAFVEIQEAKRLMSAIYGLVDDIDLMQGQIERDDLESFAKKPDEDGSASSNVMIMNIANDKKKQTLNNSIQNCWTQVREHLHALEQLVLKFEDIRNEIPSLPSSLPKTTVMPTNNIDIVLPPTQYRSSSSLSSMELLGSVRPRSIRDRSCDVNNVSDNISACSSLDDTLTANAVSQLVTSPAVEPNIRTFTEAVPVSQSPIFEITT